MSEETCPESHVPPATPGDLELPGPLAAPGALRRGPLAHPLLRTAAMICWAALSGACGERSGDPVRAAQTFTAAVQRGDVKALLPLLERAAAERLAAAAEQASDQVGGRRRIEPAEMLQIVDVDPNFELAAAELESNDGALAVVRLTGSQQERFTLTLVLEDGAWHVRIPTPPVTPTPSP